MFNDLRYSVRQLRRSPGFAFTAVLTLALAIGATTAVYSIVRGSLLAPLSYPHAEELVGIGFSQPEEGPSDEQTGETGEFLLHNAKSFSRIGLADFGSLGQNFSSGSGTAQTIHTLRVSSGYFPTLGVPPLLGRTFTEAEDLSGAAPTVVLSETFWRQALNADPSIVGHAIRINSTPQTVVGVMPSSSATVDSPDAWQPLQLSSATAGYQGDNFQMIARIKPGVSRASATAELSRITHALFSEYPRYLHWGGHGARPPAETLWPLKEIIVSNARPSLTALSAAVFAVLLMACLNLAGLIAARSSARSSEVALRVALGSSRGRTVRLLMTESLLLAICGSLAGLSLARIAVPLLLASSPIDIPALQSTAVDFEAAAFAVALGLATVLLFGLLPVLGLLRQSRTLALGATRTSGASAPQQRLGRCLIVTQVALAVTLLSVGTLLLSAFLHMRAMPPGVRIDHLYVLQVNLKGKVYAKSAQSVRFVEAVEERLRQIPGVFSVATVNGLPLDRGLNERGYPAGRKELTGVAESRFVTPGYFNAAGTTLLAGSDFSSADTLKSAPVAIINQMAADLWFPGRSPIGELVFDIDDNAPSRVIGVAENTHARGLADRIVPTIYHPYAQAEDGIIGPINGWFPTSFVIRTQERAGAADPDIAKAAEDVIAAVDPEVPAAKFVPMQSFVDHSVAAPRFFSWLAGGFAIFALGLTLIGLFGLLSYQVSSRTRELGVRMALGAQREQILGLVLRNGMVLTSVGLVLGVAGSFALRGVISSLLYTVVDGLGREDSVSILGNRALAIGLSAVAMLLATVAASLLPARRAASLEPTEALRAE